MKKEKSKSVGPLNKFVPYYPSVQTERQARNYLSDMNQDKYNSMQLIENGYADVPISEPHSSS